MGGGGIFFKYQVVRFKYLVDPPGMSPKFYFGGGMFFVEKTKAMLFVTPHNFCDTFGTLAGEAT